MNPTPDVSGHGTMFRFHQAPPVRAPAEVVNRCTRHQRQLTRCAAQWTERTKARGHRVAETWRPGSVTCWSAKAQGSKTVCTTETSETFQIKDYTFENNWTYLTCLIDEQFFFDCLNATEIDVSTGFFAPGWARRNGIVEPVILGPEGWPPRLMPSAVTIKKGGWRYKKMQKVKESHAIDVISCPNL